MRIRRESSSRRINKSGACAKREKDTWRQKKHKNDRKQSKYHRKHQVWTKILEIFVQFFLEGKKKKDNTQWALLAEAISAVTPGLAGISSLWYQALTLLVCVVFYFYFLILTPTSWLIPSIVYALRALTFFVSICDFFPSRWPPVALSCIYLVCRWYRATKWSA